MSVNAMTNAALARRSDYPAHTSSPPHTYAEIAQAANPTLTTGQDTSVNTALQTLTTYIPTEVITLYVAVVAVLAPLTQPSRLSVGAFFSPHWLAFYGFLLFTPLVVWVTFATKLKGDGKALPTTWKAWPKWEMCAATIAYVAWAFGLPASPMTIVPWYSVALAGIAVLVTSSLLGLAAPLFQAQLQTTPNLTSTSANNWPAADSTVAAGREH